MNFMNPMKLLLTFFIPGAIFLTTCQENDTYVPVKTIVLRPSSMFLAIGTEQKLGIVFSPSYASDQEIECSSSDENIATISQDGLVKTVGLGEAILTVETKDKAQNKYKKSRVTVLETLDMELNKTTITLAIGKDEMLSVLPDNEFNKKIVWSSEDENIAKVVTPGLVRGVSAGTTTITVERIDKRTVTCEVTVVEK